MAWSSKIVRADGRVLAYVLTCDYRFYLLPGDRMQPIGETEAYCWACHDFVPSERIRTPADCAAEIRWIRSLQGEERAIAESIHGAPQQVIDRCRKDIEFWRARRSSPRCLMCGSTNIFQPRVNFKGHETDRFRDRGPLLGGLRIECEGLASTGSFYRLFTLEGEEIRLPDEELVDTVNRCYGSPVCAMLKDGKRYYGRTFPKG